MRLNTPAFFDVCCDWCFASPALPEDVVLAGLGESLISLLQPQLS
ncbi:hypothetical protein [Prochlorococcus sp. MIT 1312]